MDCRAYQECVAAHVDGALDPQERDEAEAHVRACSACAELRAEQEEMKATLRASAARYPLPPEVRTHALRALEVAAGVPVEARRPGFLRQRRTTRLALVGAAAALFALVIARLVTAPGDPLLSALAEDVRSANAGRLRLEVRSHDVEELRAYYRQAGFEFEQTVGDFRDAGWSVVGATVGRIGKVRTTLTLYESSAGKIICRRFLVGTLPLPPGGERFGDYAVYSVGDVTIVIHRIGDVLCVLASTIRRAEFLRNVAGVDL